MVGAGLGLAGAGGTAGSAAAFAQAAAAAVLAAKSGGDVTVTSGHQRAQIMSKLANRPSKVIVGLFWLCIRSLLTHERRSCQS